MPICAFILRGESFRKGSQCTRSIGTPDSYDDQVLACTTQLQLIQLIESKGIEVHVYIYTYTTQYDSHLVAIFKNYIKQVIFLDSLLSSQSHLISFGLDQIEIEKYDMVSILRIDLVLKYDFFKLFDPFSNKIVFPSVTWYKDRFTPKGNPRINDIFYFFPKSKYSILYQAKDKLEFYHTFIDNVDIQPDDYTFMTDLYIDSDSEKDFSILTRISNRPECTIFHSPDKKFKDDFYNSP